MMESTESLYLLGNPKRAMSSHHSFEHELQLTRLPKRSAILESGRRRITFLDLPYELRLDIYELLLLSAEPIIVSSSRRQLRVKVEPPEQNEYLRAPRLTPRTVPLNHRKPHVAILQTCRQINREATPVVYRKNDFIVGLKVYASGKARVDPVDLASFFPSLLRPSTMLQMSSATFRGACLCHHWLTTAAGEGRIINGTDLVRICGKQTEGDRITDIDTVQTAYLTLSKGLWEMEKGVAPPRLGSMKLFDSVLKHRRLRKI